MAGRGSGTSAWGRCRIGIGSLVTLVALVLALPAAASACLEDGGGEDRYPEIGAAQITPLSLEYTGGKVVVSGEVGDDCGILSVHGEVVGSEQQIEYFEMEPAGRGDFVDRTIYRHEVTLPANYTDQPVRYFAVMSAEDTSYQSIGAFAGETEVLPAPKFDQPPTVEAATLNPRALGQPGGTVTISADASDDHSVYRVFAIVTRPDGGKEEVALDATGSGHYEGSFTAPANLGPQKQTYSAFVYAVDAKYQTGERSAGRFTVAPLPPQPRSELIVRPAARLFGRVQVGGASTRTIVVRDKAPSGAAPLAASISVSGTPFRIQGAPGGRVDFSIGPKEVRTFTLEFAPTATGLFTGSAIVSRADGAQTPTTVGLAGVGFEKRRPKPTVTPSRR